MKKTARLSKNVWLKRLKLESKIHYIYKANVRHGICLIFCSIQTCCQIGKRQEEKENIIILWTDFYSKKLCENLFFKQIKCTIAIDMVTEAKGITIISKLWFTMLTCKGIRWKTWTVPAAVIHIMELTSESHWHETKGFQVLSGRRWLCGKSEYLPDHNS